MARKPIFPPPLKCQSKSNRAYIRISAGGIDRNIYLGEYGTPEAQANYARVVAEIAAGKNLLVPDQTRGQLALAEVLSRWWVHAEGYYRKADGTSKTELTSFRYALRPVHFLYGARPAADFGPLALKAVRQLLVTGYQHPEHGQQRPQSRKVVNRNVVRIRTFFRWAESEQLVPAHTFNTLLTVSGLEEGARGVIEHDAVLPVPEADLEATLPQLNYVVRAMAQVQLWTGARPGEVVYLRPCDLRREDKVELAPGFSLDTGGKVWVFKPDEHKTAYRGHTRVILFGPKAQEILRPFLDRPADAYLFSPREAVEAFLAAQGRTVNHAAKRKPGEHYTVCSYDRSVAKACKRAGVTHFHPNQLRHSAATRIVQQFGWELARIVLGHRQIQTTQIYALEDLNKAVDAIFQAG